MKQTNQQKSLTKKSEIEWEKEFDNKRLPLEMSASPVWEEYIKRYHESIKDFIRQLFAQSRQQKKLKNNKLK